MKRFRAGVKFRQESESVGPVRLTKSAPSTHGELSRRHIHAKTQAHRQQPP